MAIYSYDRYESTGQSEFAITFDYLSTEHIEVYLDGVEQTSGYTIDAGTNKVTFTSAPDSGTVVLLKRVTPKTKAEYQAQIVDFQDGSVLTESDLDTAVLGLLYISQEAEDSATSDALQMDQTDQNWTAQEKRIKSVATPTGANDAVTKEYVDGLALYDAPSIPQLYSFTATASQTAFVMDPAPTSTDVNTFIVDLDGVVQKPTTDFTISGATLTLGTGASEDQVLTVRNIGVARDILTDSPSITGDLSVGDDLTVTDDASVGGDLTVTGGITGSSTATGSTTARTFADRFAERINVKDFGAVGDCVVDDSGDDPVVTGTDDTAAIQAALDAAAAADPIVGIYLPPGNYRCLTKLELYDTVHITGAGVHTSTLLFCGTGNFMEANEAVWFTSYTDFTIDLRNAAEVTTGEGIQGMVFNWGAARSWFTELFLYANTAGTPGDGTVPTGNGFVIQGTRRDSDGDEILQYDDDPASDTYEQWIPIPNNAQYGCYWNLVTQGHGNQTDGYAIKLNGADIEAARCNAHNIEGIKLDGYRRGVLIHGGGNSISNFTANNLITSAIHIRGDGTSSGNAVYGPQIDSAVTGYSFHLEATNIGADHVRMLNIFSTSGASRHIEDADEVYIENTAGGGLPIYSYYGAGHLVLGADNAATTTSNPADNNSAGIYPMLDDGSIFLAGYHNYKAGRVVVAGGAHEAGHRMISPGGVSVALDEGTASGNDDAEFRIVTTDNGTNYGATPVLSVDSSGNLDVSGTEISFPNLPTSDPEAVGQLWNSGGTLKVSAG
jgi:hypothetical protein